jgi:hypothetical protein
VASPLFNSKSRPKTAYHLAEVDFGRLDKSLKEIGTIVISYETCPGLFLLANEYVQGRSITYAPFPIPRYWLRHVDRIHLLIPGHGPINLKNGSQVTAIPADNVPDVLGAIQYVLEQEGFQVVIGAPTRFERPDVI